MTDLQTALVYLDSFEIPVLVSAFIALFALRGRVLRWSSKNLGVDDLKLDMLRARILMNLYLNPKGREAIETDYAEYKKAGGNGYMDVMVKEWRESAKKSKGKDV